jgi:hypothetical protein
VGSREPFRHALLSEQGDAGVARLTAEELAFCAELARDPYVRAQVAGVDDPALLAFAAGCSLAKDPAHPGKNWVTKTGGLPHFVCEVARAIHRRGVPVGHAIAIAVSRMKPSSRKSWMKAKHPKPTTRPKSAAAISDWEAKKARAHAMHATAEPIPGGAQVTTALDKVLKLSGAGAGEDDVTALDRVLVLASKADVEEKDSDKYGDEDEDTDLKDNPTYKKMLDRGMSKAAAAKFARRMSKK